MVERMERLRRFVPVAQVAVHAVKAVQADTLQSTGQWKVLQVFMNLVVDPDVVQNPESIRQFYLDELASLGRELGLLVLLVQLAVQATSMMTMQRCLAVVLPLVFHA